MEGWTSTAMLEVQKVGTTVRFSAEDEDSIIYWKAPSPYLGKKISSYGGMLKFKVLFTLAGRDSEGVVEPDIILSGNNMTVVHYHDKQPSSGETFPMEVPLLEYHFRHQSSNAQVSKEQFMMILVNLESLLIRASYFSAVGEIRYCSLYVYIYIVHGQ